MYSPDKNKVSEGWAIANPELIYFKTKLILNFFHQELLMLLKELRKFNLWHEMPVIFPVWQKKKQRRVAPIKNTWKRNGVEGQGKKSEWKAGSVRRRRSHSRNCNEILKLKYYFNNDELKRQVSVEIQKAVIKNESEKGKTEGVGPPPAHFSLHFSTVVREEKSWWR